MITAIYIIIILHHYCCRRLLCARRLEAPRSALETHALRSLVDDRSTRESIGQIFDLKGEDAGIAGKAERLQALADIRGAFSQALQDAGVDFDREAFLLRLLASPSPTLAEKRHMAAEAGTKSKSQWRELDETLAKQDRHWKKWCM